nr:hypothetical protein [Tanacetum cinerariifolium]
MRIEQYFPMTDYSLWEVILNEDSPAPTRVVDGVLQPVAPTTAEQMLARMNELKVHGTLLMALPDKHQLKFNSHKDAKTLMEVIEKKLEGILRQRRPLEIHGVSLSQKDVNLKFLRSLPSEWKTHTFIWRNKTNLEEQSLDDLFNNLKIYEAEVKSSSSAGTTTQNIAFVPSSNTDSTTESVSAASSVSTINAKLYVSFLPNIEADDLEEMDLKWQMDIVLQLSQKGTFCNGSVGLLKIFQAEDEPANYALMDFSSSSSTSNNEVFSCSKACSKAYAQLHSQYDKLTADFQSDESWPPSSLYDRFQSSNRYHAVPLPYTGTFMPPKPDLVFNNAPNGVETDHSAFNVTLSPTKPDQDLYPTYRPSAPIIEDRVSNSEDESKTKAPQTVPSFVQPTEQVQTSRPSVQHVETSIPVATLKTASPKPTSNGKRRNRKSCVVCKSLDHLIKDCDYHEKKMAPPTARNHAHRGNHKQYAPMIHKNPQKHMVPATVLNQSKPAPITAVRPVTTVVPKLKASNSPPRVTAVKAPVVNADQGLQGKWEWKPKCLVLDHGNPQHAMKDKGVIDSGCLRHMTGNMFYLSDYEELNG